MPPTVIVSFYCPLICLSHFLLLLSSIRCNPSNPKLPPPTSSVLPLCDTQCKLTVSLLITFTSKRTLLHRKHVIQALPSFCCLKTSNRPSSTHLSHFCPQLPSVCFCLFSSTYPTCKHFHFRPFTMTTLHFGPSLLAPFSQLQNPASAPILPPTSTFNLRFCQPTTFFDLDFRPSFLQLSNVPSTPKYYSPQPQSSNKQSFTTRLNQQAILIFFPTAIYCHQRFQR